jgi:hypothetical protein
VQDHVLRLKQSRGQLQEGAKADARGAEEPLVARSLIMRESAIYASAVGSHNTRAECIRRVSRPYRSSREVMCETCRPDKGPDLALVDNQ